MRTSEIKDLVEGELGYRIDKNSRERHIVYGRAIYFRICKDRTDRKSVVKEKNVDQ